MKKTVKKRRNQNKTDYSHRMGMLKSNAPRLVFRKTNKYLAAQYVQSKEAQDKIVTGFNSKLLLKYGWPKENIGGLKSTTASYLFGYLISKKIQKEKLSKPIVDFGMIRMVKKSKVHAFLKGIVDAGISIGVKEEYLPDKDRIEGKHLKNKVPVSEIKSKIDNL